VNGIRHVEEKRRKTNRNKTPCPQQVALWERRKECQEERKKIKASAFATKWEE
jgi:hypothetical protein